VDLSFPKAILPSQITRRLLWRLAQSQYDPLGLLSIYMVRWKLLMRRVSMEEKVMHLYSALNAEDETEFRALLNDMDELRKVRFPRRIASREE
jgi:hypothetical protein